MKNQFQEGDPILLKHFYYLKVHSEPEVNRVNSSKAKLNSVGYSLHIGLVLTHNLKIKVVK